MKRLILVGLLGGLLATNTGCGLLSAIFCYRPCLTRGDRVPGGCADEGCDEGCGPTCGPMNRPVRAPAYASRRALAYGDCDGCSDVGCGRPCRRPLCRSCGPGDVNPSADPCGDGCYGRCWHRGPLSCVFALLMPGCWWGPSCGERYWGDFYSDPPDCWDPCDCHGNYTGGGYGGFNEYSRAPQGVGAEDAMPVTNDNVISQTDRAVGPAPKPMAQPHKATKP